MESSQFKIILTWISQLYDHSTGRPTCENDSGFARKTDKSLEKWLKILSEAGLTKHKEIKAFLQDTHGLS